MKLLFKYPSRERPAAFFDALRSIQDNVADKENYRIFCSLDSNDPSMFNEDIRARLDAEPNLGYVYGLSKSKIDAVNRDTQHINYPWDVIVCMSDDMRFFIYGFDTIIRQAISQAFPDMDGLIHFPDQDAKHNLNTLYIVTKKYYDRFGYIYHPSYKSLWCDNESMAVAQILGKYYYDPTQMFYHLNPAYGHGPRDKMFNEQQAMWDEDLKNFNERKARNFDLP